METDTAHHGVAQAPIDRPWLNLSCVVFDRLLLCGPARGRRAELLILTARINFNP
ncbi:MAG TPA: hypothetical protein VN229_08310 [Terriglobales bacterium]|jgi:hypothetical protein|nr:hypothetical protein [Terriglobales bacterium]